MKVSVIVPVWNTRKYLKRCLESLTNQTLKDIEIVVINDKSVQDVDDIIEDYKDKIVYIKNSKNHGIGYTRNLGIKNAKGEYLGFVDSDDFVDTNMYLDYYNYAHDNKLDIVVGNYKKDMGYKVEEIYVKSFETGNIYSDKDILLKMDYGPCTKIFKRDAIIKNNILFDEELKYEDFPFVAKALKYSNRVGYLNKTYYYYNFHNSNESNTHDKRSFDILKVFDKVNDIFKDDKELKEEIEYLNVSKLLDYNIQQRNHKNSKLRNEFIDQTFDYIKKNYPNYKKNKYWKKENPLKRIVKENKILTKIVVLPMLKWLKYVKI